MPESKLAEIGGPNPVFPINLKGQAIPLLQFLIMLGETWPVETDKEWWQVHLATMCWN